MSYPAARVVKPPAGLDRRGANGERAMSAARRPPFPWSTAAAAAGLAALALALVGALALGMQLRHDLSAPGDRVARLAGSSPRLAARAPEAAASRLAERAGGAARVLGPRGRVVAEAGPAALWARGAPSWSAGVATIGVDGWRARDGAVEGTGPVAGGGRVLVRAPLPRGAGAIGVEAAAAVGVAVLVLALLAGLLAGMRARRRDAALLARASALSGLVAGRPLALGPGATGAWRVLDAGIGGVGERMAVLQRAADLGFDGVGAVLGPLAHGAAARTPSGGRLRNGALEALLGGMAFADATLVEEAVSAVLGARGPVSRRVVLSDGRSLEVDGWSAAGGRVAVVGERSEQQRLAALRLRLAGSAARQLHAPALEIQAIGRELSSQVSSGAARRLRRLLAAADRLERQVGRLLRGTPHDPRQVPPRMETLGVAGFLWGLAHDWDRALRRSALRMEVEIAADLPPVRTDATLVGEILGELVDNASKFSPRGGIVRLSAQPSAEGGVVIAVGDSGPGLDPREVPHASERFYRGAAAEALPGAGLGLGVAAALAERLGGRLALEAGPGGRARLELPGAPSPEVTASDEAPPAREVVAAVD